MNLLVPSARRCTAFCRGRIAVRDDRRHRDAARSRAAAPEPSPAARGVREVERQFYNTERGVLRPAVERGRLSSSWPT